MKKTVLILLVLLTLGLMGGLYYAFAQFDKAASAPATLADANSFPYEMPDVIINPMPFVPLY